MAISTNDRGNERDVARLVNAALAAWLFVTAFAWRNMPVHFAVVSLVGAFIVAFAPLAIGPGRLRWFNAAAGLALAIAALMLPRASAARAWVDIVVGLGVAALSLLPPFEAFTTPHPVRAWRARHPRRPRRRR
jgi:hypothetical protein